MIVAGKGGKYIHSRIDVAGAVQRIKTDDVRSIQLCGRKNELLLLLAVDRCNLAEASFGVASASTCGTSAHLSAILEKMNQGGV